MSLINILSSPQVALITFIVFLISYIIFLDVEGGFTNKFLKFGPGNKPENTASFIGIKLDSWPKVVMMYAVGFFTSLLSSYYHAVMSTSVSTYLYNAAVEDVPYSKQLMYSVVMIEPILLQILWIIQFYLDLTMELQFIIPQFIGNYIASIPFIIKMLGTKQYK